MHGRTVKDRGILIVKDVSDRDIQGLIGMNIISQCRDMFFSDIPFVNRIEAKTRMEEVRARIHSTEDVPAYSTTFSPA